MKPLLLIPFLMFSACAARAPKNATIIAIDPQGRPANTTALRTGEQLREYRFGRYADPSQPHVMHEGHPVYRIESSARWNLRPGAGNPPAQQSNVPAQSISVNDAVVAEVNKQRAVTRMVTEQTATLNQRLSEMSQAAAQSKELAKQSMALKRDLNALSGRMDSFDAQLRDQKPASADRPQPRAEDKW